MAAKMRSVRVWETAAIILAFAVAATFADGRVTLFTFSSGVAAGQTDVLVDGGTSISLRCRVEYNATQRTPTVYLKKRFPNATTVRISTNDAIDDENFASFGSRFVITPLDTKPNGNDIYEWTINNLVVGDTGIYVCYTSGANASSATVSLNVTAEPSAISFYVNDELLPPSWPTAPIQKSLTIGQTYRLRCVVSGGNPFPNVTVSNGTTAFTAISNETFTVRQDVPIPDVVNRSRALTVSWMFNKSSIGNPIVCTAGVKNQNAIIYKFLPVVDSALPQFRCDDIKKYDVSQSSFNISCDVYGNDVTLFYVTWHNGTKNSSIVGTPNSKVPLTGDARYSLYVQPPANGSIWWKMTLNVDQPKTVTDLTQNDYHFVAANRLGQAVHTVDVQKSTSTKTPVSAAGHVIGSTVGFLAALFCAMAAATYGQL